MSAAAPGSPPPSGPAACPSFRLFVEEGTIGALNLYSSHPDAFDEQDRVIGAILAAHAAVAINAVRERDRADDLEQALHSNREIGMAMGILMARGKCTSVQAFDLLRTPPRTSTSHCATWPPG